jgi:hypothetical protein
MATIKWTKGGKLIRQDMTINIYYYGETGYTVESRKKQIPHANGRAGTWEHTTYFVVKDGEDVKEFWTLKDAQAYVTNVVMERSDD